MWRLSRQWARAAAALLSPSLVWSPWGHSVCRSSRRIRAGHLKERGGEERGIKEGAREGETEKDEKRERHG